MDRCKQVFTLYTQALPAGTPVGVAVPQPVSAAISKSIKDDARDYFYSAVVSFACGCASIEKKAFTWAGIQLYYSAYLASRAILGSSEVAIVADAKNTHFSINAPKSGHISKLGKNTHAAVLHCFGVELPAHEMNTQLIQGKLPLKWMKQQRERLNYRTARFADPVVDCCFEKVMRSKVRESLSLYLSDPIYAYDADHAIVALPLRALQLTKMLFSIPGGHHISSEQEVRFVRGLSRDKRGEFTHLLEVLL